MIDINHQDPLQAENVEYWWDTIKIMVWLALAVLVAYYDSKVGKAPLGRPPNRKR